MKPIRPAVLLLLALAPLTACRREPEPVAEPQLRSDSPFQYPDELWDAGVQGRTTLRVFITEQGTVDSARIGETSGHAAFDSAALAGARRLRFEPARRGGTPIAVWRSLPVEFNLAPDGDSAAAPSQTKQPAP